MGIENAPSRMTQIEDQMTRLESVISSTVDSLLILQKRLGGILRNSPNIDKAKEKIPTDLVPFALRLYKLNERIFAIKEGIETISSNLEI